MKILALETSAKAVSAAVSKDGKILASGYQDTGLTHSRTLMPIVEAILKNAELPLTFQSCPLPNAGLAEPMRTRLFHSFPQKCAELHLRHYMSQV